MKYLSYLVLFVCFASSFFVVQAQSPINTTSANIQQSGYPLEITRIPPTSTATLTPVPTETPVGGQISGLVNARLGNWQPVSGITVQLINSANVVVAETVSANNGFFAFRLVPEGAYTVSACTMIDGVEYSGQRLGIQPGNLYASIYMLERDCS